MVCLNGHFKFLKGSLSQILPQPSRCCDTSFKSIRSTKFLLIFIKVSQCCRHPGNQEEYAKEEKERVSKEKLSIIN